MSARTYTELCEERDRLDAEVSRARRMLRAMTHASDGRPKRIVSGKLHDRMARLDAAWAAVDAELAARCAEAPVCRVCGDVNVSRTSHMHGDDLCWSCSTSLYPERHHRPYRTEEMMARGELR